MRAVGNYLTEAKQNDPRQTHLHISAPSNLKYESITRINGKK